tara:strand:+ start:409 stop:1212 length:804 start_codon:yes stop_codon:yes gene_type:complete
MKVQSYIYILVFISSFIFSCSEYQKVLKSSDINYKYDKAVQYYEKQDYNRAMPIFKELSTMLRGTKKSEKVNYFLAYCHYNTGDFLTSSYLFRSFVKTYPNSTFAEESMYMGAYCMFLESPIYSLDDTYTKKAILELKNFINKYPNTSRSNKCNELILELNDKLALKSFEKAKQYYITENYKAAIVDLNNVLIEFPSSKHREEIHFLILKSSYDLAINSISTKKEERLNKAVDAFLVFSDNYPDSKYIQEAKKIKELAVESLTKLNL